MPGSTDRQRSPVAERCALLGNRHKLQTSSMMLLAGSPPRGDGLKEPHRLTQPAPHKPGRAGGSSAHTGQPRMQWDKMLEVGELKKAGRWAEDPGLWGSKQGLVQGLLGMTPYGAAVKGKSAQESWLVSKGDLLRAQNWILYLGRLNIWRRHAWLGGELLIELAHRKEVEKV